MLTESSLWNDHDFESIKFIVVRLPFLEDFSWDYKLVSIKTDLLVILLMERVDREKCAQTKNELSMKLSN